MRRGYDAMRAPERRGRAPAGLRRVRVRSPSASEDGRFGGFGLVSGSFSTRSNQWRTLSLRLPRNAAATTRLAYLASRRSYEQADTINEYIQQVFTKHG